MLPSLHQHVDPMSRSARSHPSHPLTGVCNMPITNIKTLLQDKCLSVTKPTGHYNQQQ